MQTKVPVGVTSAAGYTTSLVLFLLAIYSFAFNHDHSDQTLGTLAAGVAAALTFLSTQVGRYLQAKELAKKAPVVQLPSVQTTGGSTGSVTFTSLPSNTNPIVKPEPGDDLDPEPPTGPDPSAAYPSLDEPEGKTVTRTDVTPVTTHHHLDG